MILGLLKFLEHELPSGCPNILHQIRIAFNLGIYQELSVLTCSFSTICIIHLYFIACSCKKCHCMDKVVELSTPLSPINLLPHLQSVTEEHTCLSLRHKDFLIKMSVFLVLFCVLHGVAIDFYAHFSLFSGNGRLVSLEDKLSTWLLYTDMDI